MTDQPGSGAPPPPPARPASPPGPPTPDASPPPGYVAAPPPGYPVAPPPGVAPGIGWSVPPADGRRASRRGWVIGCALLLLVVVVAIGACVALAARTLGPAASVIPASHGEIDLFNVQVLNGRTEVTFRTAVGVDAAEGPRLACEVVRPTLAGSDLANARWVIVNRAGDVIASDQTPCP